MHIERCDNKSFDPMSRTGLWTQSINSTDVEVITVWLSYSGWLRLRNYETSHS